MTSLLIYSNAKEIYKNNKIINDFGYTEDEFFRMCKEKIGIVPPERDQSTFWDIVRQYGQRIIKTTMKENTDIWQKIFTGKGWFKDPYYSCFIYKSGKLQKCVLADFSITTGSGRSKGKYSIEIRPS